MARHQQRELPARLVAFRVKKIEMEVSDLAFAVGTRIVDFTGLLAFRHSIEAYSGEGAVSADRDIIALTFETRANAKDSDGEQLYDIEAKFEALFEPKTNSYKLSHARRDWNAFVEYVYPLVRQVLKQQIDLTSLFDIGPPWSIDPSKGETEQLET